MNKVKLIIELDEDKYNYIKKQGTVPILYDNAIAIAVLNGTPLPKGHGRIMDIDKIIKKMEEREEQLKDNRSMYETACVETALDMFGETIIEADKENK